MQKDLQSVFQASVVANALTALLANYQVSSLFDPLDAGGVTVANLNCDRRQLLAVFSTTAKFEPDQIQGSDQSVLAFISAEQEFLSLLGSMAGPDKALVELAELTEKIVYLLGKLSIDRPSYTEAVRCDRDLLADLDDQKRSSSDDVANEVLVWFGTNRKCQRLSDGRQTFTAGRGESVYYGTCRVVIPKSHRIGSRGSGWLTRLLHGNDTVRLTRTETLEQETFWDSLKAEIAQCKDSRSAIVFIHGYNMSFEKTAICAGQLGADLDVSAAVAFFSWPSKGAFLGYPADEAAIDASAEAIEAFLVNFATRSGADKVHVIAHSMGNRGLLAAMKSITDRAAGRSSCQFGQIILAAPDVDAAAFRQRASYYVRISDRTTVYVSKADLAVRAVPRTAYLRPGRVSPNYRSRQDRHCGHDRSKCRLYRPRIRDRFKASAFGHLSTYRLRQIPPAPGDFNAVR